MALLPRVIILSLVALLAGIVPAQANEPPAPSRQAVIERVAELLEERYVDPQQGKAMSHALRREAGQFMGGDAETFADAVTQRLRELSNDGHLSLAYRPAHAEDAGADEAAELERWYGTHVNHGFEAVKRLEGGIGYLDLRVFAPVDMAGDLAAAAMSLLAQSPALVIDLRENGGGMGEMAALLEAYLFDKSVERTGLYDRPSDTLTRSFTATSIPGRRFGGSKPVYVLISRKTFSAAEEFAYDLQALQRATIVGERSGGGAHPFAYRSAGGGFFLSLPEGRSVNPVTGSNWEGTGVAPDVETAADKALEVALGMAMRAVSAEASKS